MVTVVLFPTEHIDMGIVEGTVCKSQPLSVIINLFIACVWVLFVYD